MSLKRDTDRLLSFEILPFPNSEVLLFPKSDNLGFSSFSDLKYEEEAFCFVSFKF